jgi:hypothetical protein
MRRPGRRAGKKRMLLIVNPYATTVSDRLKNLVVYALQGRYEVETVATEAQNHATEIGREVRDHGYDLVVAFGGATSSSPAGWGSTPPWSSGSTLTRG